MIFDTHCHAYWNGLPQRRKDLRRNMLSEGVTRSVQIGTGLETSRKALALAREWGPDTWCSAGIHPTGCQNLPPDSVIPLMAEVENLTRANRDKIVAVGETGLDYFHRTRGKEEAQAQTQLAFFAAQAELAQRLNLPLIIHTRNAAADTIGTIKERCVRRAVVHCFSEDVAFARELLSWSDGIYFSFSGILTYKRSLAVQEAARLLPLNRILVETDAPFLVPQAVRNSFDKNEPAFTRYVMDFLKSLRSEPVDLVERTVWENSNTFYGTEAHIPDHLN